jgi:uncharacterized protein (TIGR03083 family)
MRLAATEYERFMQVLESLGPEDWSKPTACPGWDVRAMAAHLLGMAEMAASLREQSRQTRAARRRGGLFIDALTAVQVDKHAAMTPAEIVSAYARVGRKAARARRRTPGFVRRRRMPEPQLVGGEKEDWTIGYLIDIVLTRDPWLHRIDIVRATGAPHVLTSDHDGVIVDDVVREWAQRHGRPFGLRLRGPAGGSWSAGTDGPQYDLDVVDFCLMTSGRMPAEGLLATQVPY